jgi:DNA-binding NarL/FixJ family response regulator
MTRLLIVDDHLLFLEGLTNLFEAQPDFKVVGVARSVQEAIAQAKLLRPEVILMDFLLGDGTGLDATEAILSEQPHVHIVFLTAHDEDDRLFEAIRYGAKGYLLKSISTSEMLAYLRGLKRGEVAIQPVLTSRLLVEFAQLPPRDELVSEFLSELTPRQMDIVREIQKGASNRQIASRLVLSEQTVKNHVSRILTQLNLKNRRELIKLTLPQRR